MLYNYRCRRAPACHVCVVATYRAPRGTPTSHGEVSSHRLAIYRREKKNRGTKDHEAVCTARLCCRKYPWRSCPRLALATLAAHFPEKLDFEEEGDDGQRWGPQSRGALRDHTASPVPFAFKRTTHKNTKEMALGSAHRRPKLNACWTSLFLLGPEFPHLLTTAMLAVL